VTHKPGEWSCGTPWRSPLGTDGRTACARGCACKHRDLRLRANVATARLCEAGPAQQSMRPAAACAGMEGEGPGLADGAAAGRRRAIRGRLHDRGRARVGQRGAVQGHQGRAAGGPRLHVKSWCGGRPRAGCQAAYELVLVLEARLHVDLWHGGRPRAGRQAASALRVQWKRLCLRGWCEGRAALHGALCASRQVSTGHCLQTCRSLPRCPFLRRLRRSRHCPGS